MRIFNMLSFKRQDIDTTSGHLRETVMVQAYVPGVNSGCYSKELHITAHTVRPFRLNRWLKWKFGNKESSVASITLDVGEMTRLRDEINQILRLPFKQESEG